MIHLTKATYVTSAWAGGTTTQIGFSAQESILLDGTSEQPEIHCACPTVLMLIRVWPIGKDVAE